MTTTGETGGTTYPTAGGNLFIVIGLQQLVDQRKEIRKSFPTPPRWRYTHHAEAAHDCGPCEALHDSRSHDLETVEDLHKESDRINCQQSTLWVDPSSHRQAGVNQHHNYYKIFITLILYIYQYF